MIEFIRVLKNNRHQVDTALKQYLHAFTNQQEPLIMAMHHGALIGGKRLRPFLVYQIGQLFGLSLITLDAIASAIECIHAYSLIHDDLPAMDNDVLRRGLPSCHIKFGETTAILAGDALQTLAFSILADAEMPEVNMRDRLQIISTLADASGAAGMCLGQALDLTTKDQKISVTHLEKIHRHKTGALIHAAVKMSVLAAGIHGKPIVRFLDRFAIAIGLAFQVQDDILDVISDGQGTGKRQGADQKLRKSTYPALLGLDIARAKVRDLYHESLASLECITALGYDTTMLVALARYIVERDK